MHGCILSNVATDALVLKHQVISIHSADLISIALGQFQTKMLHLWCENWIWFWKQKITLFFNGLTMSIGSDNSVTLNG